MKITVIFFIQILLSKPGSYTVRAFNADTGASTEEPLYLVPPPEPPAQMVELLEEAEEERVEKQISLDITEQMPWLPYVIVALFIILIVLFFFGNPLKQPSKKK